jgi:hypothetical protein
MRNEGVHVPKSLEAVRLLTLAEMQDARRRIAGSIVRTPLVRLDLGPEFPDIRLKLENLQATNSYKLRGAVNAVAMLFGPSAPATPGRESPMPQGKPAYPAPSSRSKPHRRQSSRG